MYACSMEILLTILARLLWLLSDDIEYIIANETRVHFLVFFIEDVEVNFDEFDYP